MYLLLITCQFLNLVSEHPGKTPELYEEPEMPCSPTNITDSTQALTSSNHQFEGDLSMFGQGTTFFSLPTN